ncbi:hypothetical protein [Rothia kristinae]|uniref:hypothetical protein n=1 Tax=Rothia kristinae TaxID=37923 RepID=UPI0022E3E286|nr:hypothetical protein [Rothia kristinae]
MTQQHQPTTHRLPAGRRRAVAMTALGVAALTLSGCGSSGTDADSSPAPTTAAASAATGGTASGATSPAPSGQSTGATATSSAAGDAALSFDGTAPLPVTAEQLVTADSRGSMSPNGLGSPEQTLRTADGGTAPDGTYQVSAGDGREGATAEVQVRGGVFSLEQDAFSTLLADKMNYMVQARGPLDAQGGVPAEPEILLGAVQYQMGSDLPGPTGDARNITGIPTVQQGFSELPMGQVEGGAATGQMDTSGLSVPRAGYVDAATGRWISGTIQGLRWSTAADGAPALTGEGLKQLRSGRYTFTYSDAAGAQHHFFLFVTGQQAGSLQSPLYSLPYAGQG